MHDLGHKNYTRSYAFNEKNIVWYVHIVEDQFQITNLSTISKVVDLQ